MKELASNLGSPSLALTGPNKPAQGNTLGDLTGVLGVLANPGALPWADLFDPFGVEETSIHPIPDTGRM